MYRNYKVRDNISIEFQIRTYYILLLSYLIKKPILVISLKYKDRNKGTKGKIHIPKKYYYTIQILQKTKV